MDTKIAPYIITFSGVFYMYHDNPVLRKSAITEYADGWHAGPVSSWKQAWAHILHLRQLVDNFPACWKAVSAASATPDSRLEERRNICYSKWEALLQPQPQVTSLEQVWPKTFAPFPAW